MTLFEALTGRAFDRLNWQHSREFDQNFSKKSNAPGFARGGGGMGGFGIDRYINLENYLLYFSFITSQFLDFRVNVRWHNYVPGICFGPDSDSFRLAELK